MGDRTRKTELFEELARVGKVLGNGKRLELLDLLAQSERSVDSLAAAADLQVSSTSAHLQVMKQAGLVATRREGTKIHYALAGPDVARLYLRLQEVAGHRSPAVDRAREAYLGTVSEGPTEVIGRQELLRLSAAGEVTVLDVRPAVEYSAGHIPGAVSIPLAQLQQRLDELPPGREIVAYCRGDYCVFAHEAVDALRAAGRPARRLHEGMLEWLLSELPVDRHDVA